jgi:hypothetical protein
MMLATGDTAIGSTSPDRQRARARNCAHAVCKAAAASVTLEAMGELPLSDAVETAQGSLHLTLYPPDLLFAVARGHFGRELLPRYMGALAEVAKSDQAVGFHDWYDMTGYDSECRRRLTDWALNNRTRIEKVHILVQHKLVAMGVATGSLLVGGDLVSTYTDRLNFRAALQNEIGRRGYAPRISLRP